VDCVCENATPAETIEVGSHMIRTIWFASLGLALVVGLLAAKVVSAPITERPVAGDGTVPARAVFRATLTKPNKTLVASAEHR
jgi:hypothetical protein